MTLKTRKLAVFVACLGIAAAFPVLSSADKGGVPNSHSKACKSHKPKKKKPMKPKPNNKGKKCGFNREPSTTVATPTTPTAAPTTSTQTQTTTTTTSTTGS